MVIGTRMFEAAKFAPPALGEVLVRERLFAQLEGAGPAARWLTAPAGAGKSTLVASFAAATGRTVLWYGVDERDDDPAFFFRAWLTVLADVLPGVALQPMTDADREADDTYAQRVTHALAQQDPIPLLVFDDLQRAGARLQQRVAALLRPDLPPLPIVCISQAPPSAPFFDAIAARRLTVCGDLGLRFSEAECAEVARMWRVDAAHAASLASISGGHAGALVLACELVRAAPDVLSGQSALAGQLHRHLLERLTERLPVPLRESLLSLASVPRITLALAQALLRDRIDDEQAIGGQLEALAAHGLLVRHRGARVTGYAMHALVRQGALAIAREQFGEAGLARMRLEGAHLLEDEGMFAEAFEVWHALGEVDNAVAALLRAAEAMACAGESTRLQAALDSLPRDAVDAHPWLAMWGGLAWLGADEDAARGWFERAYLGFETVDDRAGMLIAASSMLIDFNAVDDVIVRLGHWLERFAVLRRQFSLEAPVVLPGIYLHAIVREAMWADADQIDRDKLEGALPRLVLLVGQPAAWVSADLRLTAAMTAIEYEQGWGSHARGGLYAQATEPLARDVTISAGKRAQWWLAVARLRMYDDQVQAARDALAQLDTLVQGHGLPFAANAAALMSVELELRCGDVERAVRMIEHAAPTLARAGESDRAHLSRMRQRALLLQGRAEEALEHGEAALQAARRAGYDGSKLALFVVDHAQSLAAIGRAAEAAAQLQALARLLEPELRAPTEGVARCLDCLASQGTDLQALRDGLALARSSRYVNLLRYLPDQFSTLAALALEHDIEPGFVTELVRSRRLMPPPQAGASWPWPVRVQTLGGCGLQIDGQPYRPPHKVQDKPLELLKRLVAEQVFGRSGVDKALLAEQLWPDADPANARKSLDMTLFRLRRLLGCEAAIEGTDGRLRLSPGHVWTDVAALLGAIRGLQARRDRLATGRMVESASNGIDGLLTCWRGEFLPGDDNAPWILGARSHLASQVHAAVLAAVRAPDVDDMRRTDLLERALEKDPGAEDIARELMRTCLARREFGAALQAYARCRTALAACLGILPSAQTEALKLEIQRVAPAVADALRPATRAGQVTGTVG